MRKSVHYRMLLGAGGFAANPDGPFLVEFCKTTTILGATLLINDIIPNGATIISVSAAVGGVATLIGGNVQWVDDGLNALTPASFDYTIQDNSNPLVTSTATVTLQPFFPVTSCVDDGAASTTVSPGLGFATITEFHSLTLVKFGAGTITANDTFGGAAPANPVTLTVLTPNNPAYATLLDTSTPGIFTLTVPPGINQIEIECFGAEGGPGGAIAPGPGPGPQNVPGLGAHRTISNIAVVPGQVLSIAVGTQGIQPALNQQAGAAGGPGFADNLSFGGRAQDDSFGFPDGAILGPIGGSGIQSGSLGGGAGGGFGQNGPATVGLQGAGGGGGAASAVTKGDATTNTGVPVNKIGPVLNCAGGGGGGSGDGTGVVAIPGEDGGPPSATKAKPGPASRGATGDGGGFGSLTTGGVGGGGGGYRGGDSITTGPVRLGAGGESNDERYFLAGDRALGFRTPVPVKWLEFSGTTTVENLSLRVGNGRVIVRGRTVVDQLGGTQFPVNCEVVDAGANIVVTSDVPFGAFVLLGPLVDQCSFFYFLTDTKTGETSGVCEVKLDVVANLVNAVNDSGIGVTELVNNDVSINGVILANDTFTGTPTFEVIAGSAVNCTAVVVGGNVRVVPVARASSTTCSFQYSITDPTMPDGFEFLPNRKTDTATVSMNINLPTPIANNDGPGGLPSPIEDLGQSPPSVNVSKATLLANDVCGSQPCTFSTVRGINQIRCTAVSSGANVVVTSTAPLSAGSTCSFQYRVVNAQGAFSNWATVTLNVSAVSFVVSVDTGHHAGAAATIQGNLVVPGGASLMKTQVWGAAGGDSAGGGLGGRGAVRTCVSNVNPGDVIDFSCGERGTGGNAGGAFGGANGLGGNIFGSASSGGFFMNGFPSIGSCPLVSDGGAPVGGFNKPSGGGGTSGSNASCPGPSCQAGGSGGGAGSVVWFGSLATNNIINTAGGGGGSGSTATGSNGTTSGSSCTAHGRTMTTPSPIAASRAHGGGGGGFRGGDETAFTSDNNGGPGGGSGGNVGRFISGTQVVVTASTRTFGRVIISFA